MNSKNFETSYIDISQSKNVADMVFSLGKSLETGLFSEKKIVLDLGEIDLERPQLLGLKSLVMGAGSELALIHSSSATTKLVALEMDIRVVDNRELETQAEIKAEAIKEIVNNSNDVLSGIISQNEAIYENLSSAQEVIDEHDELLDNLMSDVKDVTHELEERLPEDVLAQVQYSDAAPIPPLAPPVQVNFEQVPEVALENAFVKMPEVLEEVQSIVMEENTEAKSYISDVIEPKEELLEKEFIIDEKAKQNIIGDTAYIKQTLRSGQVVSFDGNVVIIGDCHSGSEIVAAGDITVWGVLEGIAHAGSKGNENAIIRALKIDAIQLRIASYFARRPDRANIDFAEKTDTFTPEEARIKDGGIFIYTLNAEKQI